MKRTWQMELASDAVNDELSDLDAPAVKLIFNSGYGSANVDLMQYVAERYAQFSTGAAFRPIVSRNRAMLCSLRGKSKNYGVYTPPSASTNAITKELVDSEFGLRGGDPAKQAAAVDSLCQVVALLAATRGQPFDWSPDYYVQLGVKAALRLGLRAQAQTLLNGGLQLQPGSKELAYLARILGREVKN